MGYSINATTYRTGYNKLWKSSWNIKNKKNYYYIIREDFILNLYLNKYFKKFEKFYLKKTNVKIFRNYNKLYLLIFITDRDFNDLNDFFIKSLKPKLTLTENLLISNSNWKKQQSFLLNIINENDYQYLKNIYIKNFYKSNWQDTKIIHFILLKQLIRYQKLIKISNILLKKILINPIYFQIKRTIKYNLKHILKQNNKLKIKNIIIFENPEYINAKMLSEFIKSRLLRKYPIKKIFYLILYMLEDILKKKQIIGFKISFNGRMHRRGRAKFIWKQFFKANNSRRTNWLDYDLILFKSRYSICGIKIWLLLNKNKSKTIYEYL